MKELKRMPGIFLKVTLIRSPKSLQQALRYLVPSACFIIIQKAIQIKQGGKKLMIKKKLISRVFICIIVLVMTLSFISPSLIASAFSGVGGGQSGNGQGGGGVGNNDSLLNEEVGLRFSLVTLKNGTKTVVETSASGKYFIDVWCDGTNLNNIYREVTDYTHYPTESGTGALHDTLIYDTTSTLNKKVNGWLSAAYKKYGVTANFNIGSVLFNGMADGDAVFNEWLSGGKNKFGVNGQKFYDWAMSTSSIKIKDEGIANMEAFINCFYCTKLRDLDMSQTFLTVEPIIYYADTVSNTTYGGWDTTGTKTVATVYGYITRQQQKFKRDPGHAWAIHGRLAMLANGFCFNNVSDAKVLNSLQNVLGLRPPTDHDYYPTGSSYFYFSNFMDYVGLGIQAFWLDDFIDGGLPIDTFDITNNPKDTPDNSETPSEDNDTTGDKTIIKMYVDLYKDPNTNYYTQIVDKVQYAQKNVSDKVTITNEEPINGYKVSVWYSSGAEYKNLPKGSSMIATTDIGITDGTVKLSSLGGKQLIVNNYTSAKDYAAVSGGKSYYAGLSSPHGTNGKGSKASYTSKDAKPYTTYKRLAVSGTSNYGKYNYKVKDDDKATYVELGENEKTLVILYTREMSYISTTDTSVKKDKDARKDNSGELTIVKLYGVINPSTYEIEDITSKTLTGTTRNVNIHNEPGYNFAEWIYVTSGKQTIKNASVMGDPSYCSLDGTVDQAYRLDGFVDGFKNNASLRSGFKFNGNFPVLYTITGSNGLTSAVTPGRYSYGSRSGIGTKSYNSTIYFGGTGNLADSNVDGSDKNDVLYLLFLKADQLSYSTDDLVIPESYITRYDNYKHNPMKVTGSVSGNTYTELLQAHKFKYVLPVIKDVEYKDLNPLFIPHIKSQ